MEEKLLKISEIAERSGVSITTLKYYISKGLITHTRKTSSNMAWYSPSIIDRVIKIKHYQQEYYYPLSIIKQKFEAADKVTGQKKDFTEAVFRHSPRFQEKLVSSDQASKLTGLTYQELQMAVDHKLVSVIDAGFSSNDLEILELIKERKDAGLRVEQTIAAFEYYKDGIEKAAIKDIDSMIAKGFLDRKYTNNEILRLVRVNNYSLDRYVQLERNQAGIIEGVHRLEQYRNFAKNFTKYVSDVVIPVYGERNYNQILHFSKMEEIIKGFNSMINFNNIPNVVEIVRTSFDFFYNLDLKNISDKVERGLLTSMLLGFFCFLPDGNLRREESIKEILSTCHLDRRIYQYLKIGDENEN